MTTIGTRPGIAPDAEQIIDGYFPVLDHGFIALKDVMGDDRAIEAAARTSYQQGTRPTSETRGLLRYLMRHRHSTPFEMVELKFHVSMPIFVARQWIRHRTASVNEVSGRYSLLPMQFYTPAKEDFQLQSKDNKQGRAGGVDESLYYRSIGNWNWMRGIARGTYEFLAAHDVARELARIDLPLSTYTNWVWKIDLKNLFHFLALRVHPHAQKEIRAYAQIMAGMVQRVAPLAYEAWLDYEVCGAHFSYHELEVLRYMLAAKPEKDWLYSDHPRFEGVRGDFAKAAGLSQREWKEMLAKLARNGAGRPDFSLDLTRMCEGSVFEDEMRRTTPTLDQK